MSNNDEVNQQATQEQLAWLAGIWDGEGTFTISCSRRANGKVSYAPQITLTNSCPLMINEIGKIVDYYGITSHLWLEDLRTMKHKRCYHITMRKHEGLKKFMELVIPYLISKKAQAEILYRFVLKRMEYKRSVGRSSNGRLTGVKEQGYSEEEISLHNQIKKLNAKGCPRDYMLNTIKNSEDIVRPVWRHTETNRNS
jgi:hypothetical protein